MSDFCAIGAARADDALEVGSCLRCFAGWPSLLCWLAFAALLAGIRCFTGWYSLLCWLAVAGWPWLIRLG